MIYKLKTTEPELALRVLRLALAADDPPLRLGYRRGQIWATSLEGQDEKVVHYVYRTKTMAVAVQDKRPSE